MDPQQFADVILPLPLPQLYTYSVPKHLSDSCTPGKRVVVQFGKKKIYSALVRNIHTKAPEKYQTKNIISVLDEKSFISEIQFKFWEWIASYYMCTMGEVFKAALPSGLKLESETNIIFNKEYDGKQKLSNKEEILTQVLKDQHKLSIKDCQKILNQENVLNVINKLLERDIVKIQERLKESYKPKLEPFVKLGDDLYQEKNLHQAFNDLTNAPKQLKLLMTFIQMADHFNENNHKEVKKKDILNKSGVSHSVFSSLTEKNIFEVYFKQVDRLENTKKDIADFNKLNNHQHKALSQVHENFENNDVVLLHGVTSSGKTEIYIQLIKEYLQKGQQVLYLLPEIALTTQIINRLKNVFGNKAGVYHSKFSDAERVEIWNNVLKQHNDENYQLILGVRSSVFLPFSNIGLIIVDEEHENTYKQFDPAPRYNARDAAIVLAKLHKAKVLLGTATPSIESYYNAQKGKFGLVEMTQRFKNIELPEILIADIKKARKKKQMKSHFTPLLLEKIETSLQKNEQVILFQNRRGFSPFLECQTCGWVPKCQNCDVSLTYHKSINHLVCHYCGYTYQNPGKCEACGDTALKTQGFGTEKIEDEIAMLFPDAKIVRMDLDSTRSKTAYQRIINGFEKQQIDILIGTQMVTKGLDFNNVNTVGIMNADNLLNFPDFRAYERSFQLMAQVSGRAGRKFKRGTVVIQTSSPANTVIRDVINNDFQHLYTSQLAERKQFKYPPFYHLIKITLKHKKTNTLNNAADTLAQSLKNQFGNRILGPEFPLVNRIQNWYLKNILLKVEKEKSIQKAKLLLKKQIEKMKATEKYKSLQFVIDVDPV